MSFRVRDGSFCIVFLLPRGSVRKRHTPVCLGAKEKMLVPYGMASTGHRNTVSRVFVFTRLTSVSRLPPHAVGLVGRLAASSLGCPRMELRARHGMSMVSRSEPALIHSACR